jgi:pilus assembly protein CpaE
MARNKILIIDADAASRNFVGAALLKEEYQVQYAASGKEGLVTAWRDRPDLIIIDPVLPDLNGEELAARLRQDARTANTLLVALSSDLQPTRVRIAREAGFNEYIVKSAQAIPTLIETVNRLSGRVIAAPKAEGSLIVFLSAKGGAGTSSLCANVATNIVENKRDAKVAVVDLVLPIGSIADIVGYKGDQNLVTVADMPADMITPKFLQTNLAEMPNWRFRLLAGSPDPESANRLKAGAIDEIIGVLRTAYDFVLVDLGRALSRISLPIIERADLIALIVSTDLSTISLTKTVWDYLRYKRVEEAAIYAILNRAVGLEGLSRGEAEKLIGLKIKTSVPYLGGNFTMANNQHLPFSFKFQEDTATIVFREIARQMIELVAHRRLK